MKKLIGKTKNNLNVYVILDNKHMLAHASVTEKLLIEALAKITYTKPFWMGTVELDHVTGKNACVETTKEDDVRLEARPGRETLSRVVYSRTPEETTLLTVGICTDDDGLETVFTAFPGPKVPKELSDPRLTEEERPEAEAFWANHALCKQ